MRRWLFPLFAERYQTPAFGSVERFLKEENDDIPGYLILDMGIPKVNDSDLLHSIKMSVLKRPTVFLTSDSDIQTSTRPTRRTCRAERILTWCRTTAQQ